MKIGLYKIEMFDILGTRMVCVVELQVSPNGEPIVPDNSFTRGLKVNVIKDFESFIEVPDDYDFGGDCILCECGRVVIDSGCCDICFPADGSSNKEDHK